MSMCVLGMAEELKPDGIAVNALWPRTGECVVQKTFALFSKHYCGFKIQTSCKKHNMFVHVKFIDRLVPTNMLCFVDNVFQFQ